MVYINFIVCSLISFVRSRLAFGFDKCVKRIIEPKGNKIYRKINMSRRCIQLAYTTQTRFKNFKEKM